MYSRSTSIPTSARTVQWHSLGKHDLFTAFAQAHALADAALNLPFLVDISQSRTTLAPKAPELQKPTPAPLYLPPQMP